MTAVDRPTIVHPIIDQLALVERVREIRNRRPAVGLAVGVVRNGVLESFCADGLADIDSRRPFVEDTVVRVASITKTFTAIAILQLAEQGLVDLDAPVENYLRAYRLVPSSPGWRPATLRHLLTHTAGLGEEAPRSRAFRPDFGESFRADRPVPTLAGHYGGRLRLDAEPGTRFRYSNHGPATLGQVVEDVTGQPLDSYLREHVFRSLGMTDTELVPPSQRLRSRMATGYTLGRRGPSPVPWRNFVTAGAANACSTPRDMARYLAALLGHGSNEYGSVLQPDTVATMFDAQWRSDPRLPGMGLAFWRQTAGGHRVVEHQGLISGFDSQIFLAPDDDVAVMAFTNGTRMGGFWLPAETARLLDDLLRVPHESIRTDVPHHPEVWADLRGWYRLRGPLTDVRIRAAMGLGAEVLVHRGTLALRLLTPVPALAKPLPLHPDDVDDPYAFRVELPGTGVSMQVVFSQEPQRGTTAVHFGLMPVSADKRSDSTNPRRWATGAVALGAAAALTARRAGNRA